MPNKDYCEMCFKLKAQNNAFFVKIQKLNEMGELKMLLEICGKCSKKIIQFIYDNSNKTMKKFQGKPNSLHVDPAGEDSEGNSFESSSPVGIKSGRYKNEKSI